MEWRKKSLLFTEKQRERNRGQTNRPWRRREYNQNVGRDLRENLREKERLLQENKIRRETFRLTKKSSPNLLPRTENHEVAFQNLKTARMKAPALYTPDMKKPSIIHCDASHEMCSPITSSATMGIFFATM